MIEGPFTFVKGLFLSLGEADISLGNRQRCFRPLSFLFALTLHGLLAFGCLIKHGWLSQFLLFFYMYTSYVLFLGSSSMDASA